MPATMPMQMASWNKVTRQPRSRDGEISGIESGHTIDAMPTPTPPIRRKEISAAADRAMARTSAHATR